jgi:hypothetical protein
LSVAIRLIPTQLKTCLTPRRHGAASPATSRARPA